MGQYFKAVNLDKREVVCPWCIGGGAKLWEWAASPQGALFTLLLRSSDESGGGDYYGYGDGYGEGSPIRFPIDPIVGRWAGDSVMLVGDYDSSQLFAESAEYDNVSKRLVEAWNPFIQLDEMQLTYTRCCSCSGTES